MSKFINRSNRARLGLETLGLRAMPAVVVSQLDLDNDGGADDIMIVGDGAKNVVSIKDDGISKLTISVDANGDGDFTDAGDLNNATYNYGGRLAIVAKMGEGNDGFSYELTGPLISRVRDLDVDMGAGHDKVSVVAGDVLKSAFGGAQLDVAVKAGTGHDRVTVTTGKVEGSVVGVRMALGTGNDQGTVSFGKTDYGASVDVDAAPGAGNNKFTANFESIGYSDQADADLSVVGGINVDTVVVNLNDDVGSNAANKFSSFQVDANLMAGDDAFVTGIKVGTIIDDGSVASIHAAGGAGNDELKVQAVGVGQINIDPGALLDISLAGGNGDDEVGAYFGLPDTLQIKGGLKVRLDGGAGNDDMAAMFGNNAQTTGNYDVAVYAGAGNDEVTFSLANNGGTPTFAPKQPVLDGGTGIDKLIDLAKPISAENFFETII